MATAQAKQKPLFRTSKREGTTNPKKTDGFAVGLSQANYHIVTGIAHVRKITRVKLMNEIVDHYVKTVIAKQL